MAGYSCMAVRSISRPSFHDQIARFSLAALCHYLDGTKSRFSFGIVPVFCRPCAPILLSWSGTEGCLSSQWKTLPAIGESKPIEIFRLLFFLKRMRLFYRVPFFILVGRLFGLVCCCALSLLSLDADTSLHLLG